MFRQYPYKGWLLLSICCWSLALYWFVSHNHDMRPASMARAVQADLLQKEKEMQRVIDDGHLVQNIFSEKPAKNGIAELIKLPYGIYAYKNGNLLFWNNNKILASCGGYDTTQLVFNEHGVYVQKCFSPAYLLKNCKLTVLFPVFIQYTLENKYLKTHFEAGEHIPIETRIFSKPVKGSYAIRDINGANICYLKFDVKSIPGWIPDYFLLGILLAALLFSIAWLQLISVHISRKRSPILGFIITVALVIGVRLITYKYGLPFHLQQLPIFSSMLYATSIIHPSLGDLLLNSLCFLWIVSYLLSNMSSLQADLKRFPAVIRLLIAVVSFACIFICAFWFINIISSIIVDSTISFDVSHFYSISRYTILGLVTIGVITIGCCLFIFLANAQLSILITNKWIKYLLMAAIGIVLTVVSDRSRTGNMAYLMLGWLMLFIMLLDVRKLTYSNDILAPHMIFWAFFVCAFCTGVLFYFNSKKEIERRKTFADKIAVTRDYSTEDDFQFKNIAQSIRHDNAIETFIQNPVKESRRQINERFSNLYLSGQLNKYQANVYLFDAHGKGLFNNDTASYYQLVKELKVAEPTADSNLYYREDAQDGHYYIAAIPVFGADSSFIGSVFIDLAIKESTGETVYPELLQSSKRVNENLSEYSYAIYINHKLLSQTNDYAFPVFINGNQNAQYTYLNKEDYSELWYKVDNGKTVVVVHKSNTLLELITLFSYLFGIQVVTAILIVLYRTSLSYVLMPKGGKFISLTLRRRIHFSMLGIVLISFLFIGIVTIIYFKVQYDQSNRRRLLSVIQNVERATTQELARQNGLVNLNSFNNTVSTSLFKKFISDLSGNQKIDINIYNASGILNVTSQDNIYDRFLLARIMRQDAYYELSVKNTSLLLQNESIGNLSYLSCYVPLRDEKGNTLGYINIPYFASQKELSYQISNILVALINLYAFIFLLSGLLTVFITRWITRSFNIVIERFEKLSLSKNELVDWPYDDEIGLLVKEYNKMVKNVEENAVLLAQSEREGAWREMAQQVAHEIKNPLTPMKLNIQYLQQALKNNYDNVKELTAKVAESLIEQIDSLSYIASEFSNFAKMPEARPERIDVNDLIERAAELYLNEQTVKVSAARCPDHAYVYADRNQLLRVCTNLIMNAIQAMPDGGHGNVVVSVTCEEGNVIIAIKDDGTGIEEEIRDKIFKPYFTTKSSGTGLGLAMTKKIIEFWKGTIWFETGEGAGTTFFISLPMMKS